MLHNPKGCYVSGSGLALTYFNSLDKVARFASSCCGYKNIENYGKTRDTILN
jgi:hypothetical protein